MLIRELAAVCVAVLLCHLQLTESQVSIQLYTYIAHRTQVLKARRVTLIVRSQLRLFMTIIGVHDPLAYYMQAARFH